MEDERKTKKQLIEELNCLRLEQIEQTRVTSEKFTKAFLQNSIPVTITTAKEGRFVEVSDAFLRLVERKRDEVIGHTAIETGFLTGEQRALFYKEISKNGRVENLEMEVRPKGRGLRYGLFNVVMMSINNKNYLLTTIQDITERKLADTALKLSNERLVEAQKIAMIGDWEANLLTDELHWSQAIFDIFALDSKSFKPSVTAFYEAVHPDDRGLVLESEERSEQTGLHDVVHRIVRPSGEIRFVHELARRYKDDQGKLIKLRGTVQDITDRKQAEEKLYASEIKYRTLYQSMRDAFVSVDMEGNINDYNDSYLEMLGYAPEEINTLTSKDITPEKWHMLEANIVEKQILPKGYSGIYEKEYRRKDGTVFPVELRTTLIRNTKGAPVSMWAIVRDVTERKQVEKDREKLIIELQEAMKNVKVLRGLLPICSSCKNIRDDKGYWKQIESYIRDHSDAEFSHGICPDCMRRLYPDIYEKMQTDDKF